MANKDTRSPAELLLAPRPPLSRELSGLSALKLNLGGTALPGVISDPSQMAGPIRNKFTSALKAKVQIASIAAAVTHVLASFDTQHQQLQNGSFVAPDPLLAPIVPAGSIPNTAAFFSFSSLAPGATIPASFTALIEQRKKQLQQLVRGFSSALSGSTFSGVSLTENTNPSTYPYPDALDLPDVSRLAQGGKVAASDAILKDKTRFTVHGVTIGAGKPNFWSRLVGAATSAVPGLNSTVNQVFRDRHKSGTWSEPPTPYAAQFPYNHVQHTESGHVFELDDTPGAERVHVFHRSGSFVEFHPNGDVVFKHMKNCYQVTMADSHVKVSGNCHVAVDGNSTLYVKGNVDVQTDGDYNVRAKGDFNVFAKNVNLRAKQTFKGDGTLVDLRYIKLPTNISFETPTGVPFPRVNLTAIAADFPAANLTDITAVAKLPTLPVTGIPALSLGDASANTPMDSPLSNWSAYTAQTPQAVAYRTKFFDTPEEVQDVELYAGHTALLSTLGDMPPTARRLSGTLRTFDSGVAVPDTKPTVNYLNFDDFKGVYSYANTFALGGTSILLSDVSDLALHPDVVQDIAPATTDNFEDTPDEVVTTPDPTPDIPSEV